MSSLERPEEGGGIIPRAARLRVMSVESFEYKA